MLGPDRHGRQTMDGVTDDGKVTGSETQMSLRGVEKLK